MIETPIKIGRRCNGPRMRGASVWECAGADQPTDFADDDDRFGLVDSVFNKQRGDCGAANPHFQFCHSIKRFSETRGICLQPQYDGFHGQYDFRTHADMDRLDSDASVLLFGRPGDSEAV